MSTHTIKGLREQFKAQGKFHTPPELAKFLRSLIHGDPATVYDPTCGAGALLAEFPDAEKFGQDIDSEALADAEQLSNFHGALGDVLSEPAWMGQKFAAIVANPPFSIKWDPAVATDERFMHAPTVPTAGRADFAFLLHILHFLADDGTAAVLSFPGVLYRGNREKTLRRWLVERGVISQVISIPGDTFMDTAISTACIVFRRGSDRITFTDREHGVEETVTLDEVARQDYLLSVSAYVQPPTPRQPPFDSVAVEEAARRNLLRKLKSELLFSKQVARMEGWDTFPDLCRRAHEVIDEVAS